MLTRRQQEVLDFIARTMRSGGIAPSLAEIADALRVPSKSNAHPILVALEERGFIRRLRNRARAIEIIRLPEAHAPFWLADVTDRQLRDECARRGLNLRG